MTDNKDPMEKSLSDLKAVTRRDLIRTFGPAAAVALAGCTGNEEGGGSTDTATSAGGDQTSGSGGGGNNITPGGTLHAGISPGISTLDGRSATGTRSMQVMYQIYSKLLRWVNRDGKITLVGDLATDWNHEDDTTLVTLLHVQNQIARWNDWA